MARRGLGICSSILVLCVGAVSTLPPAARAQQYPSRTIRLLVGFPAGGPSDIPARIIAEKMQKAWGQSVVVENKTGAAGMIAMNEMLGQPRDGHTLLLCSYLDASNTLLYKSVAYKIGDIAPISLVSKAFYAFTVPTALPVKNMSVPLTFANVSNAEKLGTALSSTVPETVPSLLQSLFPAPKNRMPLTFSDDSIGEIPNAASRTVPTLVPSVFHSA